MTIVLCLVIYIASVFGAGLLVRKVYREREETPPVFVFISVFLPVVNIFISLNIIWIFMICNKWYTSWFFRLKRKENKND